MAAAVREAARIQTQSAVRKTRKRKAQPIQPGAAGGQNMRNGRVQQWHGDRSKIIRAQAARGVASAKPQRAGAQAVTSGVQNRCGKNRRIGYPGGTRTRAGVRPPRIRAAAAGARQRVRSSVRVRSNRKCVQPNQPCAACEEVGILTEVGK